MATYINTCTGYRSHLWIGIGDVKQAFCGVIVARYNADYKRQTWHVVRGVTGNPAVTCKLCLERLAGRKNQYSVPPAAIDEFPESVELAPLEPESSQVQPE